MIDLQAVINVLHTHALAAINAKSPPVSKQPSESAVVFPFTATYPQSGGGTTGGGTLGGLLDGALQNEDHRFTTVILVPSALPRGINEVTPYFTAAYNRIKADYKLGGTVIQVKGVTYQLVERTWGTDNAPLIGYEIQVQI